MWKRLRPRIRPRGRMSASVSGEPPERPQPYGGVFHIYIIQLIDIPPTPTIPVGGGEWTGDTHTHTDLPARVCVPSLPSLTYQKYWGLGS